MCDREIEKQNRRNSWSSKRNNKKKNQAKHFNSKGKKISGK